MEFNNTLIRVFFKFNFLNIFFLFLFIINNFFASNSFCDNQDELIITDSGVGNFAFYYKDKSDLFSSFRKGKFVKYDFLYFTPDKFIAYYWYKPDDVDDSAFFSGQFVTVKVILPDGTVLINNSFNTISRVRDSAGNPVYNVAKISLRLFTRNKKIKSSQYGECKIELYLNKRLIDTKKLFLGMSEQLMQWAKANDEDPRVIKHLEDVANYQGKSYYILEKDREYKYIFIGFPKDRVRKELGEPWKIKKIGKKGKEVWKYPVNTHPHPVIVEIFAINSNNIAKVLDGEHEFPMGSTLKFVFQDDKLKEIY